MSFSNGGSGGTLTLPSPTHPHHVDVQAAVRTLRRSISRSPSKFSLARTASTNSQGSDASCTSQPHSPSPSSPSIRRAVSQHFGAATTAAPLLSAPGIHNSPRTQSPLATPFRPSVKLSLRSAKISSKTTASPASAARTASRNRTSPKSPPRRALSIAFNSGNSAPILVGENESPGQENSATRRTHSPAPRKSFEKASNRHSMHLDMSGASSQIISRLMEAQGSGASSSLASPLKRSDATMSLDQSNFGSPKAKRRSYGPSSFGADFNIFDHGPGSPSFDIHDDSNREYDWTAGGTANTTEPLVPPTPGIMPRRAGSLRKSTLQQRHAGDRTSWEKRTAALQASHGPGDAGTPAKNRPRLSLDHFMPPPARDSPFSSQGPLPNPSAHVMSQTLHPPQPHPLSRTLTTSSSSSSFVDDSPTHFPVQISDKPRAPMNWSKSLPVGSLRPQPDGESQTAASVSTPEYKSAKPYLPAFASTGLVSKMNRNPEQEPVGIGTFGAAVPDTPCKKQVNGFATYPPPPPSGSAKSRSRFMRHPFGAPSTPFDSGAVKSEHTFGEQNRPSLFSGLGSRHARKGSLLSLYSDDGRPTTDQFGEVSNALDGDIPPTPTKHQLLSQSSSNLSQLSNDSPTAKRHPPASVSAVGRGLWPREARNNCEFTHPTGPDLEGGNRNVAVMDGAADLVKPIAPEEPSDPSTFPPSFHRSRARRRSFCTPTCLKIASLDPTQTTSVEVQIAKTSPSQAASPLETLEFGDIPHTPQESMAPPDASRLSISRGAEGFLHPSASERKPTFPPATPTTRHSSFPLLQNRRAITPVNGASSFDVDEALQSRFGKAELVGKGEFSEVYRVVEHERPSEAIRTSYFGTPNHRTPPSPSPDKVFAVKRLRLPLQGVKDRALRLREVSILEALRGCDHVLQLVDSWEVKNNLYIQTEYCEEGSLDRFLAAVGLKGRLDDFRIWKIMLEVSQGLKHIHDAGFVHLDLKPANILINFEGTLKIGDFGMATSLPAQGGIEEGDREYLGPEVLRGEIGKPADIFSLGLIMLEIAANVKLPDNGATWTALREGDFSEVPTLTNDTSAVLRDATGIPVDETERSVGLSTEGDMVTRSNRSGYSFRSANRYSGDIFGLARKNELQRPPNFMANPEHQSSLDSAVKWMLSAETVYRPTVSQLLELEALQWVASRQRAGATVFEGNWGPADEIAEPISFDTEMTDV